MMLSEASEVSRRSRMPAKNSDKEESDIDGADRDSVADDRSGALAQLLLPRAACGAWNNSKHASRFG
jgi:hypothetical protein